MQTRRDFMHHSGKGFLGVSLLAAAWKAETNPKPVRIGIIGAENSHSVGYGRTFNRDRKFPGVEVVGIWGETDEFARSAAQRGSIPWIVKDPQEFFGKINALIVDHRHPRYHVEAAWPFVAAGIPTFIDKPFCYRVSEGRKLLELAGAQGTAVTSFSTTARGPAVRDLREQLQASKQVHHVISAGHCDVDSKYGGVFFYGVHQVQRIMEVVGEDISRVRVSLSGAHGSALLVYPSGRQVTMLLSKDRPPFSFGVVTEQGVQALEPRVATDPLLPYQEIVDLFRDGKIARSHASLLKETAVLEALERSVTSGRWEEVPEGV